MHEPSGALVICFPSLRLSFSRASLDSIGALIYFCLLHSPTQEDPRLKLVVVMIVVPFFMNALQFRVVDSFIRKHDEHDGFEKAFSKESQLLDGESFAYRL